MKPFQVGQGLFLKYLKKLRLFFSRAFKKNRFIADGKIRQIFVICYAAIFIISIFQSQLRWFANFVKIMCSHSRWIAYSQLIRFCWIGFVRRWGNSLFSPNFFFQENPCCYQIVIYQENYVVRRFITWHTHLSNKWVY